MASDENLIHDSSMRKAPPSYIYTQSDCEPPYSMQDYPSESGTPAGQPVVAPQVYAQQPPQIQVIQQAGGYLSVGRDPVRTTCLNCRMNIQTTTRSSRKASAHLTCVILSLLCCWPCSCIPYCMDSFKNVEHSCPNCNVRVGTWSG